jgi:hypothetical protein
MADAPPLCCAHGVILGVRSGRTGLRGPLSAGPRLKGKAMINNYKISHFISNFIACLSQLHDAKQAHGAAGIVHHFKEPEIAFSAFRLIDLGVTDERQVIELPNGQRSVKAADFLKDVNEFEYWLNQRGLTLRSRFTRKEAEADNRRASAGA